MNLYEKLVYGKEKMALIGLGYVGMPIAVAFSKKIKVIGYDVNNEKVELYKQGIDPTKEIGNDKIELSNVDFTSDENRLKEALFFIVAVPTPVNDDHSPNLNPIRNASQIVGKNIRRGSIIVYESTVYPGVTEEICVPILEKESGLVYGVDFTVGYSPERINPSDKVHRLETITKIVSGMNEETLEIVAKVYELVVEAGVYKAENIKVAEAAKVIENSQRDINVAFMNELSIIFNKLNIDTHAVLKAAGTKWNFLNFTPGLVGGHCIGVDPYYLTYCAEKSGYHSQVILSGRRINDEMGKYVAENLVKKLVASDVPLKVANVVILGLTFKENCPDIRNTRVVDIIAELIEYGISPIIVDPEVDPKDALITYGIKLTEIKDVRDADAIILAVSHQVFVDKRVEDIDKLFGCNKKKVLLDLKGIYNKKEFEKKGYQYWRL